MTDGQFDVRPILLVLVIVAIVLATAQAALAKPPIDPGLTVVSSTVLGDDTFTMTVWNTSLETVDVNVPPPGTVSSVSIDIGSFDGKWTIADLGAGETGTMTGTLVS